MNHSAELLTYLLKTNTILVQSLYNLRHDDQLYMQEEVTPYHYLQVVLVLHLQPRSPRFSWWRAISFPVLALFLAIPLAQKKGHLRVAHLQTK
jgi:hypothetical protein